MPRGGARPGAGRKPKAKPVVEAVAAPAAALSPSFPGHAPAGDRRPDAPAEWPFGTQQATPPAATFVSPLEYLLSVVNDEFEDKRIRLQAASIAAPFVHVKPGEVGKKDQKADKAKSAAGGKFGASTPPKLVVNNRGA